MTKQRRVTIKDVARETGLAFSTVSNALSGKDNVRPDTRELVINTAKRLGYRTSRVARALRSNRSFVIGVLIADVANPSSADFVRGVEDVLKQVGCTMLLCNTDEELARQLTYMNNFLDHQVDGMVLISQHCNQKEVVDLLDAVPSVLVQRRDSEHRFDYVGADNTNGIIDAMRHVYALGHRRVGFVAGPRDSSSAHERRATFVDHAGDVGFDTDPDLVFDGEYTFDSGAKAAAYFLRRQKRPTCILANSDMNALGVMQYLLDAGLSVPNDMSVVGLDDIRLAGFRGINLTTIHLSKREIGARAAELLLQRIRHPDRPPQTEVLDTRLVIRGTTGKVPAP